MKENTISKMTYRATLEKRGLITLKEKTEKIHLTRSGALAICTALAILHWYMALEANNRYNGTCFLWLPWKKEGHL